ncbi:Sec-independent protein translocase protein TatB [Marichromatium bheemlicum]|uniref:Twin-arginine translocase subunit TatB n=1 Tax=Marichromatium bheemlicum TaxID=365339 RepID=A0ABX1IAM2_9GAMM|nr:Sec-independent protein translocase protein TatB [Marichromatium bheemlicum]NKN34094.1 twin-arginine translocase subunit TatB [Marichromatium bheemlicum]
MVDWGFWEFILIAVVALVVIGPERLPRVARMAGKWVGKARRTLASVKHEIDREFQTEELNRVLEEQRRARPLETLLDEPERRAPDGVKTSGAERVDPPPRD